MLFYNDDILQVDERLDIIEMIWDWYKGDLVIKFL